MSDWGYSRYKELQKLVAALNNKTSSEKADNKETHELLALIAQRLMADSEKIVNALNEIQVTLKEELQKASKPNKIVAFLEDDTTIFLMKIAVVGGISYGCWKWMGFSVSDIIDGTKCNVRGASKSISRHAGSKFGAISEKMAQWTVQLENYGKLNELNKMPNLKTQTPVEGLGIPCKLFRMDEQDIVAEAMLVTDDPITLVHGCELGRNASKVLVTKAIDPNAKVWRPTNGIQIMEEAIKSTISWPTDHIIYDVHYDNEAGGSGNDSRN